MNDSEMTLKEGVRLDPDEVAKIACALKSLSVYSDLACDDSRPEELDEVVDEGLAALNRLFDY